MADPKVRAAPRAKATPVNMVSPVTGPCEIQPTASSARTRPLRITGIMKSVRRDGRSPPVSQERSAITIGNVLKVSSASATGSRATAA
jgi:hypothetical protein